MKSWYVCGDSGKRNETFHISHITHCDFKRKSAILSFPFFFLLSMLFQEDKANNSTLAQFWTCWSYFFLTLMPVILSSCFLTSSSPVSIFHPTETARTQRFCNFLFEEFWQVLQLFYSAFTSYLLYIIQSLIPLSFCLHEISEQIISKKSKTFQIYISLKSCFP